MAIGALGALGLRAGSILGASLGKGQTVKQAVISSSIFGAGYGGLTNISWNVANTGTAFMRSNGKKYNKTSVFNLGMPYGSYGRRYSRYGRRYSRYGRRYSRYGRRSYYGRRYY